MGGRGVAAILPQVRGGTPLRNHGEWPIHGDRTLVEPPDLASSPLVAGAAGQVIWSRQLTGAAALPGAAENLLVLYHSRTLAGEPVSSV
jgi:hypothetical protein